jgi:hypothetical protein
MMGLLLRCTADETSDAATVPYRRIDTSTLGLAPNRCDAFHSHEGQIDRMTGESDARVPSERPKKVREKIRCEENAHRSASGDNRSRRLWVT